jgi:hypothetical protein
VRQITITLPLLASAFFTACGVVPPAVTVREEPGGVFIDTQLLGEYPSHIGKVEVKDLSDNQVVWRVRPDRDLFQAHGFHLSPGPNRAAPDIFWGRVVALVPDQGGTFTLKAGTMYEVSVCAPGRWAGRCTKLAFKMKS